MQFITTRGGAGISGAEAIVRGIAPDGGLYVPESFPRLSISEITGMARDSYAGLAAHILSLFLTDFSRAELDELCARAYARFDDPQIAPVKPIGGGFSLIELFHGPTQAFKDVALQILPHLLSASRRKVLEARRILILTATSGDTGKAALCGFQDVAGVDVRVFYPDGGVSEVQEAQMTTQPGENLKVFAVKGNFDDAQTEVKRIFLSKEIAHKLDERGTVLSSANSINLGRLLPQVVYYFYAYLKLLSAGAIEPGDEINFAVPTGNFGNILAAYYAKRMGLPVHKLICASNKNHVLYDFINSGEYNKNREFFLTQSPSMDILVSSNLERLLFELAGRDGARVREWMAALNEGGRYALEEDAHSRLRAAFSSGWADDEETGYAIRRARAERGIVVDPHTAVALAVAEAYREREGDRRETVVVSTASPFKFPSFVYASLTGELPPGDEFAVVSALSALIGISAPASILALPSLPVLHRDVIEVGQMKDAIFY